MRLMQTSVRYKLIFLMLISIVIPIVASIIVTYVYTKESVKDRTIEENTRLIYEGKTNITNYLEVIDNASLVLYSNTTLEGILLKGVTDNMERSYVYTALQLVSQASEHIYQVFLYLDKGHDAYLMHQGDFKGGQIAPPEMGTDLVPYAAQTIPTHWSGDYGIDLFPPKRQELVFSVYRPLYRVPTSDRIGLLSIDVSVDALRKLCSQLYDVNNEEIYIMDRDGTLIYASDETEIGQKPKQAWARTVLGATGSAGTLEASESGNNGLILFDKIKLDYLEWTIVKRIPDQYLYEHARKLTMINMIIAVLFLSVATAAVLVVSIRFTHPIKKLIRSINKIQTGQLEEPIDISRNDEFGLLAKRFQTMMHTINDLILQEYKLKLANKTIQLKMLQAQINPHFINNSLQSIGASALDHDAPEVYELLSSLGQMMHYSMNMKEMIVPLSEELDYVTHYLSLQQKRFEEKLIIEYDIDERTGPVQIPKMIVQPLVENYFKHSFHQSHRTGVLKIRMQLQNGMLHIIIEDNGIGIAQDRLSAIRDELTEPHHEHGGDQIGLINVMFRLRLYYGEQAILNLEENQPHGLKITVTVPILEGEMHR